MIKDKTIHIISQAHLDLAWLWSWRESYSEALNNLNTVVRLMEKYPELTFSYSNAVIYKWLKASAPGLFNKIKQFVSKGRWEIVGGWMVEADCNLPSGESLIRQALYGKKFFQENFGVEVKIGYCPDAFGHCEALPQILKTTGYDYYVFSKPRYGNDFPNVFKWQAPDKSQIITWRIHGGYATGPEDCPDKVEQYIRYAAENNFPENCNHTAFFLGLGDHGGGPSEAQIKRIIELSKDQSLPQIKFSTLTSMFGALQEENALADIPVIKGELHPHNIGCYSANGHIKKLNRESELTLQAAEAIATMSSLTSNSDYPTAKLSEAWEKVLFNQFHDIIAGTCIDKCYQEAEESLGYARQTAKEIITEKLHSLAQSIDTSKFENNVLFLYNPLPWTVKHTAALDMFTAIDGGNGPRIQSVIDTSTGKILPVQFTHADAPYGPWLKEWKKLLVTTEVPPCGYKLLELSTEQASSSHLPTPEFSVAKDILGLTEFENILNGTLAPVVIDDDSDTFGHQRTSFLGTRQAIQLSEKHSLENGPARNRTRLHGEFNRSDLYIDIFTYPGQSFLELVVSGNWQEKNKILKLELPTRLSNPRVYYQTPYGCTERTPNGEEVPGHSWCALTSEIDGQPYTLAVINSGIYSFDAIDGTIHLTLRRSVQKTHYNELGHSNELGIKYLDQGTFSERLWIAAIPGEWDPAEISRLAVEFQLPPSALMDTMHSGTLPTNNSYFKIESDSTIAYGWKKAEKGNGYILRLKEVSGKYDNVKITSEVLNLDLSIEIKPWELKSINCLRNVSSWDYMAASGLK